MSTQRDRSHHLRPGRSAASTSPCLLRSLSPFALLSRCIPVLLLCLACFSPARTCAETLQWRGGSLAFNDQHNWQDEIKPDSTPLLSLTSLRSDAPQEVQTVVTSGTFYVGRSIQLPSNGRLLLNAEQSVSIKFDGDVAGPTAYYNPDTTSSRHDFMCSRNWIISTLDGPKNSSGAPCINDDVSFDNSLHYELWTAQDSIAVKSISVGTVLYRSCASLPQEQFAALCPLMQIGNNLPCPGTVASTGECVCRDSCSSMNENDQREQERQQAEQEVEDLEREIIRSFDGSFSPSVLGLPINDVVALLEDPLEKQAFIDNLRIQLAAAWESDPSDVNITRIEATSSGLQLAVQGSIRAKLSDFLAPGETAGDLNPNEPYIFDIDETAGREASQITSVLRKVLATAVLDEAQADVEDQILAAAQGCSPCLRLAEALLLFGNYYKTPDSVFERVCPMASSSCTIGNVLDESQLTKRGQTLTDDQFEGMKANITELVQGIDLQASAVQTFYATALQLLGKQSELEQSRENTLPVLVTLTSPAMIVGATRPDIDLYHVIDELNFVSFTLHISQALSGVFSLDYVPPRSIQVVLYSPVLASPINGNRARRSTGISAISSNRRDLVGTHLVLRFDYQTYCVPTALDTCRFTEEDAIYASLLRRINTAVATYRVKVPECWDLTTGWSQPCLSSKAQQQTVSALHASLSRSEIVDAVTTELLELVGCGDLSRSYATSSCFHVFSGSNDYASSLAINAVNTILGSTTPVGQTMPLSSMSSTTQSATTAPQPPVTTARPPDGAASRSANSTLPIALAASCALLLLITTSILALLHARRAKEKRRQKRAEQQRTVVSFANPMYDDVMQAPPDVHPGDASLYDEPSRKQKLNPIFQGFDEDEPDETFDSKPFGARVKYDADNDTDNEEEEGAGYLDVADEEE
eukprot:m.121587 g.121587  ORF g.121587 m.121587 type:complete len:927 (+) comp15525_c0_seq1:326-3106(+)